MNVYGSRGQLLASFYAYNPRFTGGVRVAVADVNGDGIPDIITAPGPGAPADIRVFDGAHLAQANFRGGDIIREFFAYDIRFMGGAYVAAGDISRNGFADIVTGADAGGGPHVEVFSGVSGALLSSFYAFNKNFTGGVRVAVGDINGDGFPDIIAGAGPGGMPLVNVFRGASSMLLRSFDAFATSFTGGVSVAAADINHDGFADIVVGAGRGGGPFVQVFSGLDNSVLESFNAFNPAFHGGVTVAAADFNGNGFADFLIVGAGAGGGPQVNVYNPNGTLNSAFFAFNGAFPGGVFVGGG